MKKKFTIGFIICFTLLFMVGCKVKKEYIEVEKWKHDTTTVVDTMYITETHYIHDSIKAETKDSTITIVHWNYVTFDSLGNVTSQINYNSHTQHGSQGVSTSTSDSEYQKDESSSHNESNVHSEREHVVKVIKPQLYWWQKVLMWLGVISTLVVILKYRKLLVRVVKSFF